MTLTEARELFAYNKWANDHMLASLESLTAQQLERDLASSFPTILGTVAHIAAAEWIWLSRWKGTSPSAMPAWASQPVADVIRQKFSELETERCTYLATLGDTDLDRPVPFTLLSGARDAQPLRYQFQHLVNHGTYHRGQVAGMLRQLRAKPAGTDLIRWVRERT